MNTSNIINLKSVKVVSTFKVLQKDTILLATKVEIIFQNWKWSENAKFCRELLAHQEEFLNPKIK